MADVWRCSYCENLNPFVDLACPECGLPRPKSSNRFFQALQANWKAASTIGALSLIAIIIVFSCALLGFFRSTGQAAAADGGKSEVLSMVKNWTPPQNKGVSCGQAYDTLVSLYRDSLGISDAAVEWSVDNRVGKYYMVHAALKGQNGWVDYRWKVDPKTSSIATLDGMSICPYSP